MDTSILIAIIGCALAILTFYLGRMSAAKNDGEEWGELRTDLKYMKSEMSDIKKMLETTQAHTNEAIDKMQKETKDSLRRIHDRIDEHLRSDHKYVIPERKP